MYVKIGPYTPWWISSVYRDYMNKKYKYDWDEPNTLFEKSLEKLEGALTWVYAHTFNRVFARMKRKFKIKIHNYDVWGLDNTLAHIIVPALKMLKERKHGAPYVDDEDVPEHLRKSAAPPVDEWQTDDNHFKRWDWVIDEMIHAFECEIDEDWEDQFRSGTIDLRWKKNDEGSKFYEMYRGPNDTYQYDKEAADKAWARRRNGLRLFAKYYHSLWD